MGPAQEHRYVSLHLRVFDYLGLTNAGKMDVDVAWGKGRCHSKVDPLNIEGVCHPTFISQF